jgi:hypothetical protein
VAFVYCWSDHLTGKLYIGAHKGSVDDGYICSSKSMLAEYAQRPLDFERRVLRDDLSWEQARKLETGVLNELNAAKHPSFYNQTNGHVRDYDFKGASEERRRAKISAACKGRPGTNTGKKINDATRLKISERLKAIGHGYRPLTEATKEKIRQAKLGSKPLEETIRKISESNLGKKRTEESKEKMRKPKSEETRRRMSEAAKRRPPMSEETKQKIRDTLLGKYN